MKGIVLAGGAGARHYPLTLAVSKQPLPTCNKPMVFYPSSTSMLAGIRDILIITTPEDNAGFKRRLGDGTSFGINLEYAIQPSPEGLAQAFIVGEEFIGSESLCLVLGDNIFYGQPFSKTLQSVASREVGAKVFGYQVKDPEHFGVVEFNEMMKPVSIEEKPEKPKSNYAVTGLYFYDNHVVEIAKNVKPSVRAEVEITTINQMYSNDNLLNVELLGRGYAWLDTANHESLHQASSFVQTIENVQGLKVGCLEEIAWRNGWLSSEQVSLLGKPMMKNEYGRYLTHLVTGEVSS